MNYDIYIDGFIGQSDFFGEGFSSKTLREKLSEKPKGTTEITIHINSGGGSVIEGFAIHDLLKNYGLKVNTSVEGLCGSIATIVAQSNANGGKRTITKNSEYFIHNPYWTPDAPMPMEASDLESLTDSLKANEDRIATFYADVTGQNIDFLREKMKAQTSFSASEAKELGFVDEVIGEQKAYKIYSIKASGQEYRFAAFIDKQKTNTMDILQTLKDFEANVMSKIENLTKPKFKNEMKETSEGVQIFYTGDLAIGTKVFADEAMTTPAPDGVHTVGDTKYTVAGGEVTNVETSEDASALKAKVAELEAQLAEKANELQNANTEKDSLKAEVETKDAAIKEVSEQFTAFKNQFVTGTGELKPEFQAFKGETTEKKSLGQQIIELRNQNKK